MRGRSRRYWVLFLLAASVICFSQTDAKRKGKRCVDVQPGPRVISATEQAITEDPAAGIEHAVFLAVHTEHNENLELDMETCFHARIKILSNEARGLADIEFPVNEREGTLKEWWGYTILPDGSVLELKQEQLEEQTVVRTKREEVSVLKAALPGVVPGAVIDYGYKVYGRGYYPYNRVPLQRNYLIRDFRYRWTPTKWYQGAYYLTGADELAIDTAVDKEEILVTGSNLPPVHEEDLMPPDHVVRAALVLYYLPDNTNFDDFWKDTTKRHNRYLNVSTGKEGSIRKLIAEMNLPASGNLEDRLKAAYDWVGANITRIGLRTFEEIETDDDADSKKKRDVVENLLTSRTGTVFEIQRMFIGVARALGAAAEMVLVTDRTDSYFNPQLRTLRQFDATLLAVRPEGAPEQESMLLDPCSGLEYGQIPWWYAGTHGLHMAPSGPRAIQLPSTDVRQNISTAEVTLSFSDENESLISEWHKTDVGQAGLSERRYLRRLEPDKRVERLDSLCGAGPETDILTAAVVGLEELGQNLVLQCKTESWDAGIEAEIGIYRMAWNGPWVRSLPDLPDDERIHPIIFDYPRIDTLTLNVKAPAGFHAGDPPAPVTIENQLGKYIRGVATTAEGFIVERAMALYPLALPAEEYGALRSFLEEVEESDRTPLLFIREDAQP